MTQRTLGKFAQKLLSMGVSPEQAAASESAIIRQAIESAESVVGPEPRQGSRAAAEFNVCRWLCCRSVSEERADAITYLDATADRYDCQNNRGLECEACVRFNAASELFAGKHVGAAAGRLALEGES